MSDSEDATHLLTLELQKAVDDVNNVASDAASHSKKKKKKKRSRETEDGVTEVEEPVRKKSRKKKKKHDEVQETQEVQDHNSDTEFNNLIQYEPVDEPTSVEDPPEKEKRKKKKKKDKGKHRAVEEPIPTGASSEHKSTGVDSDKFVSVILAAASSQAAENHSGEPSVDPSTAGYPPLSPPPSHFPYPEHYVPYPNQPGMPFVPPPAPFGHPPQGQPMFPDFGSLALPDLANASNDDILRGLQNLDMEKIANLVKSLGEMANITLSAPPSFVHNPAPPGPTPVRQVPARSDAILGRQLKQPKSGQAKQAKVLPANIPPEEDANPEHAHLLANTWMNATKLAEVARKEGKEILILIRDLSLILNRDCLQEGQVLCHRGSPAERCY